MLLRLIENIKIEPIEENTLKSENVIDPCDPLNSSTVFPMAVPPNSAPNCAPNSSSNCASKASCQEKRYCYDKNHTQSFVNLTNLDAIS